METHTHEGMSAQDFSSLSAEDVQRLLALEEKELQANANAADHSEVIAALKARLAELGRMERN